jgi:hypothetical protein
MRSNSFRNLQGISVRDILCLFGGRRMSLSLWDEGSDSDHVTGLNLDNRLVGHRKILAWQWAMLPPYRREGAVEGRPFAVKMRPSLSEAQGTLDSVKGTGRRR